MKLHRVPTTNLLDDHVDLDYLNKKKKKKKLRQIKRRTDDLKKEKKQLSRQISMTKSSPLQNDRIEDELKILYKDKKKIKKKIKKSEKKKKKIKNELSEFDERFDISHEVENSVNNDGLFRTFDNRYIINGILDVSIMTIGKLLNYAKPNYRRIVELVESVIGNLSLCDCDSDEIDLDMIDIFTNKILKHRAILNRIDPVAIVLYNKFLILSRISYASIIYDCDNITNSTRFSVAYKRICEGKYPFDQFVVFSKFQRRYMSQVQQTLFTQYQRVIRVMEDMGVIDCKSDRLKQKVRNGLRDLGIKRNQIGQIAHYAYDKTLDAAQNYYASKDKKYAEAFDVARNLSRFSPDYAGELYAMDSF